MSCSSRVYKIKADGVKLNEDGEVIVSLDHSPLKLKFDFEKQHAHHNNNSGSERSWTRWFDGSIKFDGLTVHTHVIDLNLRDHPNVLENISALATQRANKLQEAADNIPALPAAMQPGFKSPVVEPAIIEAPVEAPAIMVGEPVRV